MAQAKGLRKARVQLQANVRGRIDSREIIVLASDEAGACGAARAIVGPLFEVRSVSWVS